MVVFSKFWEHIHAVRENFWKNQDNDMISHEQNSYFQNMFSWYFMIYYPIVAYWRHMVPQIWVNIGSVNGLLPYNIKPLPESMLVSHQWSFAQTLQRLFMLYWSEMHFDNFLEFQTWLHKELLLALPYFSLVLLLFHRSWTKDRQVSQSFLRHSHDSNFTASAQATVLHNEFENYTLKLLLHLPGANDLTD